VTRLAIRKHDITAQTGPSRPHDTPTFRLIHTDCQRRLIRYVSSRPDRPPPAGSPQSPDPRWKCKQARRDGAEQRSQGLVEPVNLGL
jgi:hypothetical protein